MQSNAISYGMTWKDEEEEEKDVRKIHTTQIIKQGSNVHEIANFKYRRIQFSSLFHFTFSLIISLLLAETYKNALVFKPKTICT